MLRCIGEGESLQLVHQQRAKLRLQAKNPVAGPAHGARELFADSFHRGGIVQHASGQPEQRGMRGGPGQGFRPTAQNFQQPHLPRGELPDQLPDIRRDRVGKQPQGMVLRQGVNIER